MAREELEQLIGETRNEPPWRKAADRDCDYYDGNQLTPAVLGQMEDKGIPPIIINSVQPIVNVALGMEAKTRSDWEVTADDKPSEMVGQYLNERLNEAERESGADRAVSEAYAGQIKGGLGWVEVSDEQDPFRYPYRVKMVHRREIWWDWRARELDLSDARYLIRRRWYDQDVLITMLPEFERLIRNSINSWEGFNYTVMAFADTQSLELARSYDEQRGSTLDQYEWLDLSRKRAQVFEVWYRRWVRGHVFRLPNHRVIEVDRKNQKHLQVIASGAMTPIPAVFPKMRVSMWLGPHRLTDVPSPLPHRDFPYVPFWGYREDLTGAPYGIIRALVSPQDEINARRSKLLSLITGRRIIMDDDALNNTWNSVDDVADEAAASDGVIVLNSARRNKEGFRVETNADLAAGQMKTLADAKSEMHEVSGIFPPSMGDPQAGLSGVAIDSLVDQSSTTLAEINDNHRFGRRKVGELLLAHVRRDLAHEHEAMVGTGRNAKPVYFNRSFFNPEIGEQDIENSVMDAAVRVTLSEVPSTPTYRRQQFTMLAEMTKGLPPDVQRFVMDFVIEASDVKDRGKIADRIRKALGLPDPNAADDEQTDAVNAQIQQLQAAHEEQMGELMKQLQPALQQVSELKLQIANRESELALQAEAERNRHAEAQMSADQQAASDARAHELALEKLDLEHAKLNHDASKVEGDRNFQREQADAQVMREQQAAAMQPADDSGEKLDQMLASAMDDVRDMVKALADEMGGLQKSVAEVKKEAGQKVPEPVKAEDIAAALTKALGPILESKKEATPPPPPTVIVLPSEGGETEKRIIIETDDTGMPMGATVKESRTKKPKKEA